MKSAKIGGPIIPSTEIPIMPNIAFQPHSPMLDSLGGYLGGNNYTPSNFMRFHNGPPLSAINPNGENYKILAPRPITPSNQESGQLSSKHATYLKASPRMADAQMSA